MDFLSSIEMLRKVSWGASYLWDCRLKGSAGSPKSPEEPFHDWFPAVSLSTPLGDLQAFSFESGNYNFDIPKGRGALSASIVFLDNDEGSLEIFFRDWYEEIAPLDFRGVTALYSSVKELEVHKVTREKELRKRKAERIYYVYPLGVMSDNNDSESSVKQFTVNLSIAGIKGV